MVAQAAYEELGLERMFFIPAGQSPFKRDQRPADGLERARLLRLALAGCCWAEVDDQELRRDGVSFTIDTLRAYASRFPGAELHYLIGADNVPALPQWRNPEELARLASFAVVPRPGQAEVALPAPFRGRMLRGWPLAVSSSEIRERLRARQSVTHLVPPLVAEALANNPLYL
jgi:nicotinate-nucleotide adenylyltransferase